MDFQINLPGNDLGTTRTVSSVGEMAFVKNTDIRTDVYLSLNIKKGSWFANPKFGCDLFKIRKITAGNLVLAKQYVEAALQWMIITGRAKAVTVVVERNSQNLWYMSISISITQADGMVFFYQMYQDVSTGKIVWTAVGGPSATWTAL